MKGKFKQTVNSTGFIILLGLVIVPILSFLLITSSEESPLYASISRIAWALDHWWATFIWAIVVMASILWLTYKTIGCGPLSLPCRVSLTVAQFFNISMVFIGCIIFPAKTGQGEPMLINYLHDYVTIIAWVLYGVGLIVYSFMLGRHSSLLGYLGIGLMTFTVFSSYFFIKQVIHPDSYVGASAVSEVHIINSLLIFLVVIHVAQKYEEQIRTSSTNQAAAAIKH